MVEFNEAFEFISGDIIDLKLIKFYEGDDVQIPYYWYDIILKDIQKAIGKISIRIGHNYHSYYNGNIGYEIDEEHRGNCYSYLASRMILEVARFYGMEKLYLTCKEGNVASYKIIEKLGAEMIEIVVPPEKYFGYYEGIPPQRIYKLKV